MSEPRLRSGAPTRGRAAPAGASSHLEVTLAPGAGSLELPASRHALATISYGEPPASGSAHPGGLDLCVSLPQLGERPLREVWSTAEEPHAGECAGLRFARTSELLMGALELPGAVPDAETFDAYRRILALTAAQGMHLVRTWNVLPRLHSGEPRIDRYKQFCRGRARAFEAHHGPGFERHLCASSAVGSASGPALVYFLAARQPGEHRENRRQLSAYRYPPRYGPRSPSFARATRTREGLLLISGTASIVGHESVHLGDAAAQTAETLRNLRVLVGGPRGTSLADRMPLVKVYLRDAADHEIVRPLLAEAFGTAHPSLHLQADICRPELLVEIEGFACSGP